jgi:hypothetical protein
VSHHTKDDDCTLDASDTCTECGVWHGDPCPECGGSGYHAPGCAIIAEEVTFPVRRSEGAKVLIWCFLAVLWFAWSSLLVVLR